jgi:hypothetical protein
MNMYFLPWSNNASPETDEDDPAQSSWLQQITIFYKNSVSQHRYSKQQIWEYGFELWHNLIAWGDDVLRTYVCKTIVEILETQENTDTIIKNIFRNNS